MRTLVLTLVLASGCAVRSAALVPAPAPAPPPRGQHATRLDVELRSSREGSTLRVTIEADGEAQDLSRFCGALPSAATDVSASDANGASKARFVEAGGQTCVEFAPAPRPPLRLSYSLAAPPLPAGAAQGGRAQPPGLHVEPTEFRTRGEVFVLPAAWSNRSVPVRIRLGADGEKDARAASTFGLGGDVSRLLRGRELAAGYFLVGRLGDARFVADDGEDHAAWRGYFGFDPRWVSAEAAGVRAATDAWVGVRTPQRSALLLISVTRPDVPFSFHPFAGGIVAEIQTGAAWSAPARIRLGQQLVARWVGGALGIGEGSEDSRWWSDGASRAIAREVLFELGVLTADERAEELSSLLAAEALSPLAGETLAALGGREDVEARRLVAARGALAVTLADARVRRATAGKRGLREVVRGLFERAARDGKATLPFRSFEEALALELGPNAAREVADSLRGAAPVPLPADLLGSCYRLRPRAVAAFELGLRVSTAEPPIVESVAAGSAAARAGVQVGDRVGALTYQDGRADVGARGVFTRGGKELPLRWTPAGSSRPGRAFERAPGLREDRCG